MARTGGSWGMLPKAFPPWQTVYWWFRRFVRRLLFMSIHDSGGDVRPRADGPRDRALVGMLDSQTVKAPGAAVRSCDAGKKIVGRKRHIAVDNDERFLMVNLTTADLSKRRRADDPRRDPQALAAGRWRRLVRDYEKRIDVSTAMIHVAMGNMLWRRIVH